MKPALLGNMMREEIDGEQPWLTQFYLTFENGRGHVKKVWLSITPHRFDQSSLFHE